MNEPIQIVDTNNIPLRGGTKQEAWRSGLYHQIVRVVLRDKNGAILLQKRTPDMEIYPSRWTDSASGHVDAGEQPDAAAKRELREELGIVAPLRYVGTFLTEIVLGDKKVNTYNIVYFGSADTKTKIMHDVAEVAATKWLQPDELRAEIAKNPHAYTPYIAQILRDYIEE